MKMNKTNEDLVDYLVKRNLIKTEKVKQAFLKVDRRDFVGEKHRQRSYLDTPLQIGHNQTSSAPHMVAIMTEQLDVDKNSKIMEIGSGSGYQAAILGEMAENGEVHTTEIKEPLFHMAKRNLENYSNIHLHQKDGSRGIPEVSPFDRIISTCGAPEIPKEWKKQLKETGIILAPIGGKFHQRLKKYIKEEGELKEQDLNLPCAFVPMKGERGF